MTTEEFSEEIGRVFQAEWKKAQFWARIKCFGGAHGRATTPVVEEGIA